MLRPARAADLDALWPLWTDPDVRRFLWDDRVIGREEAQATLEDCLALAPRIWHHGYALEALRALLEHASTTLGLTRLAGVTDVPNVASDRMLRRAGFVPLGGVEGCCSGSGRTFGRRRAR